MDNGGGRYLKIARGTANQFCVLEKPLGSGGWDIEQGGFESVKIFLFLFNFYFIFGCFGSSLLCAGFL